MDTSIIYGKKTIGFPTTMEDVPRLASILREDINNNVGKFSLIGIDKETAEKSIINYFNANDVMAWTFSTKQGKVSKVCSYVFLSNRTQCQMTLEQIIDPDFSKGLTTFVRNDKYTFSEDSIKGVVNFAFNTLGINRVECEVIDGDRRIMELLKKSGFSREGVRRNAVIIGEKLTNIHIFGAIK